MTDKATAAEEIPTFDDQGMFAFLDKWLVLSSERRTPEVEPGSSLAGDAQRSPALQVAHAAWTAFTDSVDHLAALRTLLVETEAPLPVHAPFTLVRSAIENAATAVWLLAPQRRSERLRRRLKLAHHEVWESGQALKLLPAEFAGDRSVQEIQADIRALAVQLGLDPDDVAGRFSYEKVIWTAGEATGVGGDRSVLVWRVGSGIAHGRDWARRMSARHLQVITEDDLISTQLTTDVGKVLSAAGYPFTFTNRALWLYEQRRRSPYSSGQRTAS
jgi:hypothetical protein